MSRLKVALLATLVLALATVGYLTRAPDGARVVESLRRAHALCAPQLPELSGELRFLLQATPFADRWSINGEPRSGALNLYFLCAASGAPPATNARSLDRLQGNCAYVGAPGVVVCDPTLFTTFVQTSGIAGELYAFPSREEQIRRTQRSILLWILGHEIGHVVSGHKPAHFMTDQITASVSNLSLDQALELAADRWFIEHLQRDADRQIAVENTLLSLVYAQVRAKVGSDNLFPATGVPITNQLIQYATDSSHPEFVIRAVRMLSLSLDRPDAAFMKYQIDNLQRVLRESTAPPG